MAVRILIFCAGIAVASAAVKFQEVYSWNILDWNYPDQYLKQQALQTGALIRQNALPVGIERWRDKLFVSVPRWRPGIPATLNYIPLDAPYEPSPNLTPWPNFKANELGDCENGLTTVYRIKADSCDRLWVLDVGTYGYDPNVTNVCPYAINVYDLNTDRRIRRYVFRPEDIVSTTFIANIALDEGLTCDDTFAYFSDELGYGLIAYSWEQNKSWRFSHSYFMPDPLVGDFNIAGLNFQWGAEGIFGISASPMGVDGFRTLYFSPLSSYTEFSVSTRILRDESKVTGSYKDFKVVGTRGRDTHTTAKVMDVTGVQLFNLIDQNAIGCWSSNFALKPQNIAIIDKDDVGLVFPCDVKIDVNRNVWIISDRMPVFLESELNYGDVNFRIYVASLDKLIQGTVCETSPPPNRSNSLLSRPTLYNSGGSNSVSQVPPGFILQNTPSRSLTSNFNTQFSTTNRPITQNINPQFSTTNRPVTQNFNPQLMTSNRPLTQNFNTQFGSSNRPTFGSQFDTSSRPIFGSHFGTSNRPTYVSQLGVSNRQPFRSQFGTSRSLPFNTQLGTSTRSLTPSLNSQSPSSITSSNTVSKLYNPLLNSQQTSQPFTVSPLTSGLTNMVNPWWLKDQDYQVVEK